LTKKLVTSQLLEIWTEKWYVLFLTLPSNKFFSGSHIGKWNNCKS
jgi:hypothetical protein